MSSAAVIAAYVAVVRDAGHIRWLNWANVAGGAVLAVADAAAGAYPAAALSVVFSAVGGWGLWRARRRRL